MVSSVLAVCVCVCVYGGVPWKWLAVHRFVRLLVSCSSVWLVGSSFALYLTHWPGPLSPLSPSLSLDTAEKPVPMGAKHSTLPALNPRGGRLFVAVEFLLWARLGITQNEDTPLLPCRLWYSFTAAPLPSAVTSLV